MLTEYGHAQDRYTKYIPLLDSFMTAQAKINHFNGNVLVAHEGDVIYKKSFGYRNYDTKELLDENTVFEIASVSKQFTAAGILLLIEKGKLKFTDTLRQFFPELPYPNVTIKDLITHTSGLPNYMIEMIKKWDHSNIAFNDDLIKFLAKEKIPPDFQPGERFEYSNLAYSLLASIIEKVSGKSFADYMKENIFVPLGMNSSFVFNTRRSTGILPDNYALGYVFSDSLKKYVLPDSTREYEFVRYLDGIVGDGIVNSTTGDLLKWDRALKNHTLLGESMQKEMFTHHSRFDTTIKIYYGYGVFLDSNFWGKRIFHGGAWPGYSTNLTRFVDDDITVIILSNNQTFATTLATTAGYLLRGGMIEVPYTHNEIELGSEVVERYAGKYLIPSGIQFELISKNGKLYQHTLQKDFELKPESNNKFFYTDSDTQIEFITDQSGKIQKIFLIDAGLKTEIEKL